MLIGVSAPIIKAKQNCHIEEGRIMEITERIPRGSPTPATFSEEYYGNIIQAGPPRSPVLQERSPLESFFLFPFFKLTF